MKKLFLYGLVGLAIPLLASAHTTAQGDPPITCDKLETRLSDDKNFYVFSAKASGDSAEITGYHFDFGDHQSYTFNFPAANTDHHSATVTHTYAAAGTYDTYVHINTKTKDHISSVGSEACKNTVHISTPENAAPVTELPNTGAGNTAAIVAGTVVIATFAHHLWLRRRVYLTMD